MYNTIQYNKLSCVCVCGGGGGVKFLNWTNYLFHFLSAKMYLFHTLPQAKNINIYDDFRFQKPLDYKKIKIK